MSDHWDRAVAETDITDLYVFQKPGEVSKTIFVLNVNPDAPGRATAFSHEAVYEIKIDTTADAVAEIAFRVTFSPVQRQGSDTRQCATVRRAEGEEAAGDGRCGQVIVNHAPVSFGATPEVTEAGPYCFFAGVRSDPFFADAEGAKNNFQFTGRDSAAGRNVFGIVLEVPNTDLGSNPEIGVWARVLLPHDTRFLQVDRAGRPLANSAFNADSPEDQEVFNQIPPTQDRERFGQTYISVLQRLGGYTLDGAERIMEMLLPDILSYNYLLTTGYPNGRTLVDDVADVTWSLLTNKRAPDDGVGPHTDLLTEFPYLGSPHRSPAS